MYGAKLALREKAMEWKNSTDIGELPPLADAGKLGDINSNGTHLQWLICGNQRLT
jgi:hypothetical protein